MRFSDKWKKMRDRNIIKSNHVTPHLCGRKSFGRKRQEIKIKIGKTPSRAELFIATRTKPDGSFVSDDRGSNTRGFGGWTANFPPAFVNIANPPNAQAIGNGMNGNHNGQERGGDKP